MQGMQGRQGMTHGYGSGLPNPVPCSQDSDQAARDIDQLLMTSSNMQQPQLQPQHALDLQHLVLLSVCVPQVL